MHSGSNDTNGNQAQDNNPKSQAEDHHQEELDSESKRERKGSRAGSKESKEAQEADDVLADEIAKLEFGVHKSLRYHAKRRAFLLSLHRFTVAIAAITGSAAFVSLVGDNPGLAAGLSLFVAIVTGRDAVFGYAEHARIHDDLYKRFTDLAVDIERVGMNATVSTLHELRATRLLIEKDEPTSITALNIKCHNEEAEARGLTTDRVRLYGYQSLFANFMTLPPDFFPQLEVAVVDPQPTEIELAIQVTRTSVFKIKADRLVVRCRRLTLCFYKSSREYLFCHETLQHILPT